jgi:hypothetical protein
MRINRTAESSGRGQADECDAATGHELLHALRLGSGIVVTITFEKIDCAPDTEASAQRDYEGLKNVNSRVKESHNLPPYI